LLYYIIYFLNIITLLFFIAFENNTQKYIYCFIITEILSFITITNFLYVNGETPSTLIVNDTINKISELEPFYNVTSLECLDSKEI
jgi:hypothetical protein